MEKVVLGKGGSGRNSTISNILTPAYSKCYSKTGASALPGKLLEMQKPRLYLRPTVLVS